MALLTFQVLEGMERGRVLSDLKTPLTIGREEDNGVQLNDERISRFHAKIQEDGGRVILTDLESTNGTRVNGHPVKMHVLQIGDQISLGRCLLLFGSAEEIELRIRQQHSPPENSNGTVTVDPDPYVLADPDLQDPDEEVQRLFPAGAPELPSSLRGVQVAQLSDLLAHLQDRLHSVANAGRATGNNEPQVVELDWIAWQRLLKLQMDIATYLRELTEPSWSEG